MFPEAVRAVRELQPQAFIFENVKGLLRTQFKNYFRYVLLQLAFPETTQRRGESWKQHFWRLESHAQKHDAKYNATFKLLNAANYGVPQKRERVFIVGFRADLGIKWTFPSETHSQDALLISQFISGDYWKRHGIGKRLQPPAGPRIAARVHRLQHRSLADTGKLPWRTVRDAIGDLPDPERHRDGGIANHIFNPGARSYKGHTGSPYDEVAKTLKAGDHGVPGGENMIAKRDESVRYFTVREAARLQTFPDDYVFRGPWSEAMRQLGNAVPVKLAEVVASSVSQSLVKVTLRDHAPIVKAGSVVSLTATA
jgi:DNA (cytosine-5)-methyltransferase 1